MRQGKVTDNKKERIGAKPTRWFDPKPVPAQPDGGEGLSDEEEPPASGAGPSAAGQRRERAPSAVLYRAGQLLVIKPDRAQGEVWLAQLLEPIVGPSSRRRSFNTERPQVAYYVASHLLDTWPRGGF